MASASNSATPSISSRPTTPGLSTPSPSMNIESRGDDGSRLKLLLSLLRKFIGVADIANVRFSLPSQLLEPIPNLEYWQYLDRPETFASIGQSDDELGRFLEVLRFWFTKDLKFVKGKPCKPYNSTLGEFFRCNWEIKQPAEPIRSPSTAPRQPAPDPLQPATGASESDPCRITFLCEQTSHHPPASAYWAECPSRGLVARGYDQILAKFSGTYIRVMPGGYNKGIFVSIKHRNEEYHMTHPESQLNGFLRGNLYISVADVAVIECEKTKLRCLLHYVEESWLGKAQNKLIGVIYRYDPAAASQYTKPKDVPANEVLVNIEGDWKDKVYYSIPNSKAVKSYLNADSPPKLPLEPTKEKQLIIDLVPLMPVPKIVPPPDLQLSNESRRLWEQVTDAIMSKNYGEATKLKQDIEQAQRDRAAEREREKLVYRPRFFNEMVASPDGRPTLSEEGKAVIAGMQDLQFEMKPRQQDSVPIASQ